MRSTRDVEPDDVGEDDCDGLALHVAESTKWRAEVARPFAPRLEPVPAIVIPYRGDAKRRLPSSLRAAVAVAMLGDVVEAALAVGRVLVVTDDPAVVPAFVEVVPDPGEGMGAAVAAGLARVDGHALVVNADLPAATSAALGRLADAGLALVEAADGTTNALSLPDPSVFAPLYGPGSADRFRAHAPFATVPFPSSSSTSTPTRISSASRLPCSGHGRARFSPFPREGRPAVRRRRRRALRARPRRGPRARRAHGRRQRRRRRRDPRPPRLARPRQPRLHARRAHRRRARLGASRRDLERPRVGGELRWGGLVSAR